MTTDSNMIDVAVALPVYHTFSYLVPANLAALVAVGKRVLVPFGSRQITGYVVGFQTEAQPEGIKKIVDVLDEAPLVPTAMMPFFFWMADYYKHPVGEVIKSALPGGLTVHDLSYVAITTKGMELLGNAGLSTPEAEILEHLLTKPCSVKALRKNLERGISMAKLHAMETRGWINVGKKLKRDRTRVKTERYLKINHSAIPGSRLTPKREKIIELLSTNGDMPLKHLKEQLPGAANLIRPLVKSGHVTPYEKKVYRDPFGDSISTDSARRLNPEQKKVFSTLCDSLGKGFMTYLLAGVTGSGKTEVYLQLAAKVIAEGAPVLVLVPEIALISQMERRFRARFGDCVAVLHSGLSDGERYDQWLRIVAKEVFIVVGARSAVFAPLESLGLVIVDEEHDTSYKQESGFRYHARDLAVVRAKQQNCLVLLGSATPSIQSFHNVKTGKFKVVRLNKRVEEQPLPSIDVVDLGKSRNDRGTRRIITRELESAMQETLGRDEQVLLFLNRRGFAGYPVCRRCGESLRCRQCEISLTFHREHNAYKCHYCGYTRPSTARCAGCGSSSILRLGVGTEKVEAAVKSLFPASRIARMDRDTTLRKGALLKILKQIRDHDVDVIVGTQMVAKGHDYPKITLVGIICADLSLSVPDFRSSERTFQLLAQVAGRAGRGDKPGKVILQTYNPGHFSILAAKQQDFDSFYKKEIRYRKELCYPPFSRMVQIQISGSQRQETQKTAVALGESCRLIRNERKIYRAHIEVLGPIPFPIARIAGKYRWQILLKGSKTTPLHRLVSEFMHDSRTLLNHRRVAVAVDVDPFLTM